MAVETGNVIWNREISPLYMHIGIECGDAYSNALPGQFVMIKRDCRIDPLLRRPFSIHQVTRKEGRVTGIELLYKVVGRSTENLSMLKAGEDVELVGPLGRGFTLPDSGQRVFITAGGIGIAPFAFLASRLIENGVDPSLCHVFIGGRSAEDVLFADFFRESGMTVHTATDDGSLGHKGFITELIDKELSVDRPDVLYTCGPHPMLKAVADMAERHEVRCQVSVETLMACGIGACMGCAMDRRDDKNSYVHACMNGPVFDSKELML